MRLVQRRPAFSAYFLFTLLPPAIAINIVCSDVVVDSKRFDLSKLGGPKTVTETQDLPPNSYVETAFTIDICQKLDKTGPKGEDCPHGTRVCGYRTVFDTVRNTSTLAGAIPIAGDYTTSGAVGGGDFNPKWTRLKTSDSQSDRDKEGLRLRMGGGRYLSETRMRDQKAVVEFLCDRKDTAEERRRGILATDDSNDGESIVDKPSEEERKKKEQTDDGEGGVLKFVGYDLVGEDEVLSLEWRTKYACEDRTDDAPKSSSGHWGFFTWFIIIFFLGVAAYLIFGSWLNYNRYSARGWDLVPHSETLRDIPYIFKDWMRRVGNTLQGGGSRGGYSAV